MPSGLVARLLSLVLLLALGCKGSDLSGQRIAFGGGRLWAGSTSSSASTTFDGPHDRHFSSSADASSDGDAYISTVEWSMPLGDDPAASQIRILNAQVGGMRAELATTNRMLATLAETMTRMAPPAPEEPVVFVGPPLPEGLEPELFPTDVLPPLEGDPSAAHGPEGGDTPAPGGPGPEVSGELSPTAQLAIGAGLLAALVALVSAAFKRRRARRAKQGTIPPASRRSAP